MMRIIAGEMKGRKLLAAEHLRPTTDRVREALFSILGGMLSGRFVDCYAGSGAVGLEARSRGADVIFVERDPDSLATLRENIERLDVQGRVTVVPADSLRFLKSPEAATALNPVAWPEPAAVIFADPPYDYHAQEKLLRVLAATPIAGPETVLVVERRTGVRTRTPDTLSLEREVDYGKSGLSFYRRTAAGPPLSG